ncbi:MAG: bifunctional phosphoribosyl-AMP cyclohydrolase/phosphoribosyl-ATP diphosphatase HisIE [Aureispira sp.]
MKIDFEKGAGLVPAIVQDAQTQKVLMLGYVNQPSWEQTLTTKLVTFFSRSKQRLWTKGESSGNFLELMDWRLDCDQDTLLLWVTPKGPVCHTGTDTCFGEENKGKFDLAYLETVLQARKDTPTLNSYSSQLLARGINKVAQKVGEEAVELVIEAKDDNQELFLGEAADLAYHYLLLLVAKGHSLEEVLGVLEARHKK